jgi:hypothetical protein
MSPGVRTGVRLAHFVAAMALIAGPATAWAQGEIQAWLDPMLGKQMARGEYRLLYYPDRPVDGQEVDFGLTEHRLVLSAPVFQDSEQEWTLSGRAAYQDIRTRAILPDTGERFPSELWDVRLDVGHRRRFENGWTAGILVSVGSASDRPFAGIDEMFWRTLALLRVPHGERHAWLFSLAYASDQEYLGGIPVPGIAFQYAPSDRLQAVIGLPFTSVRVRPLDALTLEATYVPVRRVRARATYQALPPLRVYLGFDWGHDSYFRADRRDDDDQLFYYEKRITLGARFDLRHVGIEVSGGYAFDRFYFEGEKYSHRDRNRLDVDAGAFVSVRLSVRL